MTIPSRRGALHILALIATDDIEHTKLTNLYENQPHHTAADVRIPRLCNTDSPVMHNVSNLHLDAKLVSCPTDPNSTRKPISSHTAAEESISNASNSSSSSSSSSSISSVMSSAASGRRTRSGGKNDRERRTRSASSQHSSLELKRKLELRIKRKQTIEKAKKISSLDNSPANDRQLHVLRMVYDEITMYPTEPWIAILAIIIHRSFKQVKNWFSNERQKRGTGEETSVMSSAGDRIRLRPISRDCCNDLSDEWFEEVVMIHHYRVLCNSRWQAGRALSDTSSNYDGRS